MLMTLEMGVHGCFDALSANAIVDLVPNFGG